MSHTNTPRSAFTVITPFYGVVAAGCDLLCHKLKIHCDRFSRTISRRHKTIIKEFFGYVWDRGDIYLSEQKGCYCLSCKEFKEQRHLLAGRRCPLHSNKDILRFHGVYSPAMLISAGLPVLSRDCGQGFLTQDGQKMRKSLGNTLDPLELVDWYSTKAILYSSSLELVQGRKTASC